MESGGGGAYQRSRPLPCRTSVVTFWAPLESAAAEPTHPNFPHANPKPQSKPHPHVHRTSGFSCFRVRARRPAASGSGDKASLPAAVAPLDARSALPPPFLHRCELDRPVLQTSSCTAGHRGAGDAAGCSAGARARGWPWPRSAAGEAAHTAQKAAPRQPSLGRHQPQAGGACAAHERLGARAAGAADAVDWVPPAAAAAARVVAISS